MKTTVIISRAAAILALTMTGACAAVAQGRCSDAEVKSLTVGGKPYFVQAQTLAFDGKRALILGYPVLYWSSPSSDDGALDSASVGVLWEPGHDGITVPKPPVAGVLDGFRAASLGDGRWAVVFAARDSMTRRSDPPVARLYTGETDGRRWFGLDTLPGIRDSIRYRQTSRLVPSGDELRLAVTNQEYLGGRVTVFRRMVSGQWAVSTYAQPMVTYPVPVPGDTLAAIVIRPIPEPGAANQGSVLLVRPGGDSGAVSIVKREGRNGHYDPEVVRLRDRLLVGWTKLSGGLRSVELATVRAGDSVAVSGFAPRDDELLMAVNNPSSALILTYNYSDSTPISLYRYKDEPLLWFERSKPFRGTIQMAAGDGTLLVAGALAGSDHFYQTGALLFSTGCIP